jgi:hypothetical protein
MRSSFLRVFVVMLLWSGRGSTTEAIATVTHLKEEGTRAFQRKDWPGALQAFEQAYALSKDPTFLYNQARTLESMLELPRALDALEAFERDASPELRAKVAGLPELLLSIRGRVANVVLRVNVADAEVRINERTVTKSVLPETRFRVTRGRLRGSVHAENFYPCRFELIDLTPMETRYVTCELASRSTSGVLTIRSTAGATITLDGKERGMVPFEGEVAAGTHRVAIRKQGYEPHASSLVVRANESKLLERPLEVIPGIASRWWFWTGLGVLVAGGVVTGIALTTERAPDRGTIAPGVVRSASF